VSDESDLIIRASDIRVVPLIGGWRVREEAEWRGGRGEGGGQKCVVRFFHYLCVGSACFERICERSDSIFLHFSV